MSLARPKRQATINKSYNDTLDEYFFEEKSENTSSSASSTTGKRKYQKKLITPTEAKSSNSSTNNNKNALPYNWQPSLSPIDYFSNKLDLTDAYIDLNKSTLYCPHQAPIPMTFDTIRRRKTKEAFQLKKGDYIYMVSEPPGEPYYIGRIMGFNKKNNSKHDVHHEIDTENSIVDAKEYVFQIQWFYRPRDISKSTSDTRLLYASMHSDTCPLASFRGLVIVKHKQDIEDEYDNQNTSTESSKSSSPSNLTALEIYTQQPNTFYFDKLFDRYMLKFYDIISTYSLLKFADIEGNTSKNFLIALHKRFEFIFVETQRSKSLINGFSSNSCNCEKCYQWCSSQDSVICVVCDKYYHMLCLEPPLLKKPSRGFSWSCAACTKKHDLEYQSKKMLMLSHDNKSSNEREITTEISVLSSPVDSATDSEEDALSGSVLPKYEIMAIDFLKKDSQFSLEERRLKEEWSMRYLGMHARLEDGVDLEDRSPYPRASTRLGSKHQATNIPEFDDHPIIYYDVEKPKGAATKKKNSVNKKPISKSKQKGDQDILKLEVPKEFEDVSPQDYPQWLQPRPKGYIERGLDDITSTLMWKPLESEKAGLALDIYLAKCVPMAEKLKLLPNSPNFMDAVLKIYLDFKEDIEDSLINVSKLTRKSLHEPTFTKEEIKRFEAGVKEHGSELHPVFKQVKTQPCSMVVRYYYLWKKTKNGRLIWGNFEGRRQKKLVNMAKEEAATSGNKSDMKLEAHDDLIDPDDDSSYEGDKIVSKNESIECKYCHTVQSIKWFRITGSDLSSQMEDESNALSDPHVIHGLCFRCARLWRRYAIVWEDPNEVEKKNSKSVGGWKKKIEFELIRDSNTILNEAEARGGGLSYNKDEINASNSISANKAKRTYTKANLSITSKKPSIMKEENPPKRKKTASVVVSNGAIAEKENVSVKGKAASKVTEPKPSTKSSKKISKPNIAAPISAPKAVKEKKPKTQEKVTKKTNGKEKTTPLENAKPTKQGKGASADGKRKKAESSTKAVVKDEEKAATNKASGIQVPSAPHKRQKKVVATLFNKVINPIFNSNYLPPKIGPTTKIDKKNIPVINKDILEDIVSNFRIRQLTDITTQLQTMQVPHLSSIKLPFETYDRKCCLCREHDKSEASNSSMLICSHCGVNVHSTCVGINISSQISRPIKEWLCEACVNDLKPFHSTLYSCSLCLANESNYELSILGCPQVRPDYLKPVFETGKWCHLLCALFNYDMVDFKHIPYSSSNTRRLLKDQVSDQKSIIESMQNTISIESISKIYLKNYTSKCGICSTLNGSLVACHMCEASGNEDNKYHITCAQDTPNFKLGFKLDSQSLNEKDSKLTTVGTMYGRLRPILVCPRHDQSIATIYDMRALGSRMFGIGKDEKKPLIQLFLEDVVKLNPVKFTGAQFRSNKYIENCRSFEQEEIKHNLQNQLLKLFNAANKISVKKPDDQKICGRCNTTASPMWWIKNLSQNSTEPEKYLCQSCYHVCDKNTDYDESEVNIEDESESLIELLNKPLIGANYGLLDDEDKLSEVYKPELNKHDKSEVRSRISIGDILS